MSFPRLDTQQIAHDLGKLAEHADFRTGLVRPCFYRALHDFVMSEASVKFDIEDPATDKLLPEYPRDNFPTEQLCPALGVVGTNPEKFPCCRGEETSEKVTIEAAVDVTARAHNPARPNDINLYAFHLMKPAHMPHLVERRGKICIPKANPFCLLAFFGELQNSRAHRCSLATVFRTPEKLETRLAVNFCLNEFRRAIARSIIDKQSPQLVLPRPRGKRADIQPLPLIEAGHRQKNFRTLRPPHKMISSTFLVSLPA